MHKLEGDKTVRHAGHHRCVAAAPSRAIRSPIWSIARAFMWNFLAGDNLTMWIADVDHPSKTVFRGSSRLHRAGDDPRHAQVRRRCSGPALGCSSASRCARFAWRRRETPEGAFAIGVCGSAAVYVLTFFAVGVASDFRYAYWAVLASIAGAVALARSAERANPQTLNRHKLRLGKLCEAATQFVKARRTCRISTIRPPSNTRMRVALRIVARRCAMTNVVRFFMTSSSAASTPGFGRGIERAGRLIENQDRRILQQRARNRQALALAARQRAPALAHFGFKSVGIVFDEIECLRPRGGRAHLFVVASGLPMRRFSAIERLNSKAS